MNVQEHQLVDTDCVRGHCSMAKSIEVNWCTKATVCQKHISGLKEERFSACLNTTYTVMLHVLMSSSDNGMYFRHSDYLPVQNQELALLPLVTHWDVDYSS